MPRRGVSIRGAVVPTAAAALLLLSAPASALPGVLSCSREAATTDPCSVLSPGGLIIFRQRFEPEVGGDHGTWGIDGLEVLDCGTQAPSKNVPFSRSYTHEEITSFCLKAPVFGGEEGYTRAESLWAPHEAGEGVEEIWERSWNSAGRKLSTLSPSCLKDLPRGHEVPLYLSVLHGLHKLFSTAKLLADSDITPSHDTTYPLSEITAALSIDGQEALIGCVNHTLSTVSWPLHAKGPFQAGDFQSAVTRGLTSNCPLEGIIYPPSTSAMLNTRRSTTTEAAWDPIYRPTPRPITLSNDDSRLYYPSAGAEPTAQSGEDLTERLNPKKLSFFKGADENREHKPDNLGRKFGRDEL